MVQFAIEHDRMHQETLCYMLAQGRKAAFEQRVPPKQLLRIFASKVPSTEPDILIPAGTVRLGVDFDQGFVWDNEGPPTPPADLAAFKVSSVPVSVAQFRQFVIGDRGYERPELWDPQDYAFFKDREQSAPATWSLLDGEFYVHSPTGSSHWSEVASSPVMVSLSEASAFCAAKSCRVMTEQEYQRILDSPEGENVQNMRSGGWEWTSTEFQPFPGFRAMDSYPEYSTDFFDGQHYVLKGASDVTHPSMFRDSFRNFYQKQYPFVFAKFRCCRD